MRTPIHRSGESGTSILELLATMTVIVLAAGMAGTLLKPAAAPLESSSVLLERLFTAARAKATATTSAYRIAPVSPTRIVADHAASCTDVAWTFDDALELDLPQDVAMPDTGWSVCFGSRGAANANVTVTLTHPTAGTRRVEVFAGGAARVVP